MKTLAFALLCHILSISVVHGKGIQPLALFPTKGTINLTRGIAKPLQSICTRGALDAPWGEAYEYVSSPGKVILKVDGEVYEGGLQKALEDKVIKLQAEGYSTTYISIHPDHPTAKSVEFEILESPVISTELPKGKVSTYDQVLQRFPDDLNPSAIAKKGLSDYQEDYWAAERLMELNYKGKDGSLKSAHDQFRSEFTDDVLKKYLGLKRDEWFPDDGGLRSVTQTVKELRKRDFWIESGGAKESFIKSMDDVRAKLQIADENAYIVVPPDGPVVVRYENGDDFLKHLEKQKAMKSSQCELEVCFKRKYGGEYSELTFTSKCPGISAQLSSSGSLSLTVGAGPISQNFTLVNGKTLKRATDYCSITREYCSGSKPLDKTEGLSLNCNGESISINNKSTISLSSGGTSVSLQP